MPERNEPLESSSPDDLDDMDQTIQAQDADEMSLLDEGATIVGDAVIPEELEADFELDPSLYAGTSRYEIIDPDKPIGKGGFGTVWKVRDRKLGSILVMKRLHSAEEAGQQGIARFINEARTIASLNHQNIITVSDIGKDGKGYYIIAEYVDGGSLRNRIDEKGGLSQKEAIDIIEQVGRAIAYAHRRGVIHRDIKPANILLTRDGIPKVADFGLAKIGKDSDLSVSGMAMGSLAFMPPEQRKDAKSADHRADIYALGKTLYHTLTGKIPETIRESEIPTMLRSALLKAIEPLPEDRYFTVEEFVRDLRDGRGAEVTQETIKAGICPECGWKNPTDGDYCEGCGAGLVENCPVCQRKKRVGLVFCAGCGTEIPKYIETGDRIEKVKKYMSEKVYQKAERECRKILSENPHKDQKKEIEEYLKEAGKKLEEIKRLREKAIVHHQEEKYEEEEPILNELLGLLPEAEAGDVQSQVSELPKLIRERDIRNTLKRADDFFRSGNYLKAMVSYKEASELGAEGMEVRIYEARDQEIARNFSQVESFLEHYNFEKAIALLKKILELKPDHETAQTRIRDIEKHQGLLKRRLSEMEDSFQNMDYSQAEVLRQEVLSLHPHQIEAKLMEDRIKEVRNQISEILEKTRSAFEKQDYKYVKRLVASAYSLDPKSDEVKRQESELEGKIDFHVSQILTQAKKSLADKKYRKTMVESGEILELVPGHAEAKKVQSHAHDRLVSLTAMVGEAEAYHQKGKYRQAKKIIQNAIKFGPHNEPAIELKNKNIEAIRERRKSRIIGTFGIVAIIGIVLIAIIEFNGRCIRSARAFASKGSYKEAIREFDKTMLSLGISAPKEKLAAELVASLLARADEMIAARKYTEGLGDTAVSTLKLVLRLEPENSQAKRKMAEIRELYVLSGDNAFTYKDYWTAKRFYSIVRSIWPGYALDTSKLSICEDWLRKNAQKIESLMAKANGQLVAQKYTTPEGDNAFATLKAILEIDPNNKKAKARVIKIRDYYMGFGDRALSGMNYSKAEDFYQKALMVFPGYELAKSKLGECQKQLGVINAKRRVKIEEARTKAIEGENINKGTRSTASGADSTFSKPSLEGIWQGRGRQTSGSTWSIRISISPGRYSIEYPSLSCGGNLTFLEETETSMSFREKITYGKRACLDGGKVELRKTGRNSADFIYYLKNGRRDATGKITREAVNKHD